MAENKEIKDVLGEEPIAFTSDGEPIYQSEESDYRLRDKIQKDARANRPRQAQQPVVQKPSKRSGSLATRPSHPIDSSWGMGDINRRASQISRSRR